ncbi:hypothetical protein ACFX12_031009 [Malus domestica]
MARTKGKKLCRAKCALLGSTYPGGLPPALSVLKNVLSTIKKAVTLLDIRNLSLLRKMNILQFMGWEEAAPEWIVVIGVFVEPRILGMRFSTILFLQGWKLD